MASCMAASTSAFSDSTTSSSTSFHATSTTATIPTPPWVETRKVFVRRLVPMLLATIVDNRGTIRTNARIVAKVHRRMLQDRHKHIRMHH
ncbi:hypothetical protein E2562_027443 [Oryza meyeriana var. granulata]|uniref:Uncharacterized protein n=1 Tax=Oryza meyeriana var. granulata TaxID=110450 RepID=A0A6G1CJ04_9ORYZ|nr:hypothetical protein E2562_027443 [Oryza meyeriana var. granulata]